MAASDASLATIRLGPMPMLQSSPDSDLIRSRSRSATGSSDTGWSRSVPVKSTYPSSSPAITTSGENSSITPRTSRDARR